MNLFPPDLWFVAQMEHEGMVTVDVSGRGEPWGFVRVTVQKAQDDYQLMELADRYIRSSLAAALSEKGESP